MNSIEQMAKEAGRGEQFDLWLRLRAEAMITVNKIQYATFAENDNETIQAGEGLFWSKIDNHLLRINSEAYVLSYFNNSYIQEIRVGELSICYDPRETTVELTVEDHEGYSIIAYDGEIDPLLAALQQVKSNMTH